MDTAEELESLCYGGEEFLASATVAGGAIGITSHRVLVLKPDSPGARFHAVHRPNVRGFATRSTGPTGHRSLAIVAGVIGLGLIVAGAVIDFGGLPGILGPLAEALRSLGLLAVLAALGLMGRYLWKATWVIEVTVAGADDLRIPITRDEMSVVDRLETLRSEGRPDGAPMGPDG